MHKYYSLNYKDTCMSYYGILNRESEKFLIVFQHCLKCSVLSMLKTSLLIKYNSLNITLKGREQS